MKNIARKTALAFAVMIAAVGVVSIPTAAEADSGWGWVVGRN
ncbi:hypothetical protein [Nocardioides sp. WS12]|nr:hypothetical protein [Nocardioides sp. WS12]